MPLELCDPKRRVWFRDAVCVKTLVKLEAEVITQGALDQENETHRFIHIVYGHFMNIYPCVI